MQRRFRRTCPVCGRPDLKNISTHLLQVHGLSSEERKPYLKQAQVSSWQPRIQGRQSVLKTEGDRLENEEVQGYMFPYFIFESVFFDVPRAIYGYCS